MSLGVTVDPTAPEAGARILDAIRTGGVSLPGPGLSPSLVRVSPLGLGESYAAWLVTDGAASVVIRLARRRPEDMACPMIDEFRAGPLIPDGIGSRPLAMDDSADNPLGAPYLVSTFAPGVVREPSAWDPPLLRAHARRLASAAGSSGVVGTSPGMARGPAFRHLPAGQGPDRLRRHPRPVSPARADRL